MSNLRLIVAITGASGVIYGKKLLEFLKKKNVKVHLIISDVARKIIEHELKEPAQNLEKLATNSYSPKDLLAPISSGSFKTEGMIIIPCSMKTLAGIACGYTDNLILRAADVTLKEGRKLILVPRETPLNAIHLENMLKLAKQGVFIVPAMPAYYFNPQKIEDLVNYIVGKVLGLLGIEHNLYKKWK